MKKTLSFLLPVLLCFLTGFIAGRFQTDALQYWYPFLNKPSLTPPDIVFPIAWSILYLCMGLSAGLVLTAGTFRKRALLSLFVVQLCLNFIWSILFFYFRNPTAGFIDVLLLDITVIGYILTGWRTDKAAALLFLPYLLWLCFATYLNGYVLCFN